MQRILLIVGLLLGMVIFTDCTPKSKAGESCAKTADCTSGLQCMKLTCVDVKKAVAEANQECRRSPICTNMGHCTAKRIKVIDGDTMCIATSNDDCERSEYCRKYGQCVVKDGKCVK